MEMKVMADTRGCSFAGNSPEVPWQLRFESSQALKSMLRRGNTPKEEFEKALFV